MINEMCANIAYEVEKEVASRYDGVYGKIVAIEAEVIDTKGDFEPNDEIYAAFDRVLATSFDFDRRVDVEGSQSRVKKALEAYRAKLEANVEQANS